MKSGFSRNLLIATLASSALAGLATPAFAQEAQGAAEIEPGEIIVSARRRDETLQDTPVAITAINAAMLESKASVNIGDLTGAAPNLLITNQNSGAAAANLSIRGLTYADIEKSQEPTVGVVVDGVFIGTSTGQFFDFFDIDQVEVLRGPQGTLFGRNTIGGVISIKRSRPTGELGGKMEVSYGKFNTLATRAVLNVPIIEGKGLAAKFFYFHNDSDGWYRHGITGKRAGSSNNENFGASFLVQPEGSGFDALLTVEKQIQRFDPVVSNIAQTGEVFCAFEPANECNRNTSSDLYTVFGIPAVSNYSAPSVTLEMNYDLGGVKLTSVSGYRRSHENQTQDFDGSSTDLYYTRRQQDYKQWSQELRAAGKIGDTFDYVTGVYYFKSDYNLVQHSRVFGFNPTVDPLIFDKNPQQVIGSNKSAAVFGDFNWAFADQFRLSFGGRYTVDKKGLTNSFGGVQVGTGSGTFKKFTPKVGVDFRPDNNTMIYASWSRGYRSGGFSPRAATAATASVAYQPETVDSFEVGTKLDLLDRKLQLNLAAFYSNYKGLQQNTTIPGGPTGNQTITSNVGSSKIKGIEMDFTARPAHGVRITGSMGYLTNNLQNFIVGGVTPAGVIKPFDFSNNEMIYAPKFNGSFAVDYTVPTSFGEVLANIGYRHIGRYDQQISVNPLTNFSTATVIVAGNDPRVRGNPQDLVDASLSTKFEIGGVDAKLTIFGRNLLNDKGSTHAFTVAGLWSFGTAREPRTYGASLGFKF